MTDTTRILELPTGQHGDIFYSDCMFECVGWGGGNRAAKLNTRQPFLYLLVELADPNAPSPLAYKLLLKVYLNMESIMAERLQRAVRNSKDYRF